MKYDIKTLVEKNEKLEELMINMSSGNLPIGNSTNISFEDNLISYLNKQLPLQTDEALQEFENKLEDGIFR